MENQQIQLTKQGGNVFVITLTGTPHKANVFNTGMLKRLDVLLDEIEEQEIPCAVIFTGAGKFFSAGFDLEALTGKSHVSTSTPNDSSGRQTKTAEGQALVNLSWKVLARILVFPAPTIAVFNGHAFGLGFFLGLACDHRIMMEVEKRYLCLPEITIGLPLGSGFAALAQCKLPKAALRTSALTGKRWSSQEAFKSGLIDAVVPPAHDGETLPGEALALAKSLVSTSEKGNLNSIKLEIYAETYTRLLRPEANRSKL